MAPNFLGRALALSIAAHVAAIAFVAFLSAPDRPPAPPRKAVTVRLERGPGSTATAPAGRPAVERSAPRRELLVTDRPDAPRVHVARHEAREPADIAPPEPAGTESQGPIGGIATVSGALFPGWGSPRTRGWRAPTVALADAAGIDSRADRLRADLAMARAETLARFEAYCRHRLAERADDPAQTVEPGCEAADAPSGP